MTSSYESYPFSRNIYRDITTQHPRDIENSYYPRSSNDRNPESYPRNNYPRDNEQRANHNRTSPEIDQLPVRTAPYVENSYPESQPRNNYPRGNEQGANHNRTNSEINQLPIRTAPYTEDFDYAFNRMSFGITRNVDSSRPSNEERTHNFKFPKQELNNRHWNNRPQVYLNPEESQRNPMTEMTPHRSQSNMTAQAYHVIRK